MSITNLWHNDCKIPDLTSCDGSQSKHRHTAQRLFSVPKVKRLSCPFYSCDISFAHMPSFSDVSMLTNVNKMAHVQPWHTNGWFPMMLYMGPRPTCITHCVFFFACSLLWVLKILLKMLKRPADTSTGNNEKKSWKHLRLPTGQKVKLLEKLLLQQHDYLCCRQT